MNNKDLPGMIQFGKIIAATIIFLLLCVPAAGKNLSVSDIQIKNINREKQFAEINFSISWENSWRCDIEGDGYKQPYNYDAVWVFVKYKERYSAEWKHAELSIVSEHHIPAKGAAIKATRDGLGIFIYRASNGSGDVSYRDNLLRWYCDPSVVNSPEDYDIKLFAIEMVNIPYGEFYAGDGSSYGAFYSGEKGNPVLITDQICEIKSTNNVFDDTHIRSEGIILSGQGGLGEFENFIDLTRFPGGVRAFYIMKYELTQGGYAEFLNNISAEQAERRYLNRTNNFRNTVSFTRHEGARIYTASRPGRACNYLSWMDGAAYLDWSGLRPLSELEFEKAARGYNSEAGQAIAAAEGAPAWGNNNAYPGNVVSASETEFYKAEGNCCFNSVTYRSGDKEKGPVNAGSFEKKVFPCEENGSSYFGVFDLSGNVSEYCVTIGNNAGRSYTGLHGDGYLTSDGFANVDFWPGINGNTRIDFPGNVFLKELNNYTGVTGAAGSGTRGGDWSNKENRLAISDRAFASQPGSSRERTTGIRGARSVD
jgi:formylglycine-generating enzyme required for sulfatase activity